MSGRDVIVVGASAGGIQAVKGLLAHLPADLRATIFVMLHRSSRAGSIDYLPAVFQRESPLPVVAASDGQVFRRGHVYTAPPAARLLLDHGQLRVDPVSSPRPSRAAVDTLFRSAASTYGKRVAAVLLTGTLDDGTAGLWEVRRHGGITLVQDPRQAEFASMPLTAVKDVPVHYCLPVPEIASKLVQLSTEEPEPARSPRVLIVEGERIVAVNLETRLADLGYEVVGSVATGEAALRIVAAASPDVVLMDVQLQGSMKGTDAARVLWEQLELPIVYLTAYTDEQTLRDVQPSMPYGLVVKPYRAAQVHAALQLALDRRAREKRSHAT